MKFLSRDDVSLRPVEKEDAEFLRDLMTHPDVRDTLGRAPLPVNRENEEEYVERVSENDEDIVFIIEKEGEPAGNLGLHIESRTYRRCEFYIAIHPEFHGEGVGTVATEMAVEYAFDELNMQKVRGGYLEDNPASRRIQEKAGLSEVGRFQRYKRRDGEWLDVIWMEVLEEEWRER